MQVRPLSQLYSRLRAAIFRRHSLVLLGGALLAFSPVVLSAQSVGFVGSQTPLVAAMPTFAQPNVPANPSRITQAVDDSVLTTMHGNTHPLARAEFDKGVAPPSQPMNHIQLILQRSPSQEAALKSFLDSLQLTGSPQYHKWLTPEQFGALYGPADVDIQKLTDWLEGRGFVVNRVGKGRVAIDFSGSVAQVEDAFHTSIHSYQANGVEFIANTIDPQIPLALSPVVAGVTHLNTVPIRPAYVKGTPATYDPSSHRFVPTPPTDGVEPEFTGVNGEGDTVLYTVAADAATIYNTPNKTLNANFSAGASYDGTGVTIGIAGQSSIDTSIIGTYRGLFLGDTKVPTVSNIDNVGDNDDDTEAYLDNEVSGALAPGASLHFYTATDVLTASQVAIEENTIDILSLSFLSCEMDLGSIGNIELNNEWQQAAAQGITVIVSAGDSGSATCDYFRAENGNLVTSATLGLAVNGLASTPYDIAVGGTDYDVLLGNFSQYVNTASHTSLYGTALGYIPEATWNNSTTQGNNTTVSANIPWSIASGEQNILAGGGGASNCSTLTDAGACSAGYPKPSWQIGKGVPNDNARDLPDVSLLSANELYSATWGVCDDNSAIRDGVLVTFNCAPDANNSFHIDGVGGTSASAPAFAGIMALVVQKTGERQGAAAPVLYGLFNSTPSVFHDVILGNNAVPCTISSLNSADCVTNSGGYDYESGFNTGAGYDLATGLGSVDATSLVTNWSAGTVTGGTQSQTITFGMLANQTYGAAPLILSATASSGLAVSFASTTPAVCTVTVTSATLVGAGTCKIEATQAGNTEYAAATPVTQSFTVSKAVVTITANNATRPYGAANPVFSYKLSGFLNGDTSNVVIGVARLTTTATAASAADTYPISVSIAPLLAANYTFTSVDGTLTVAKAVVTITANNATRPYGAANPVFSYKLSGFVNGDTSGVVIGVARMTTTATAASAAGNYPISVSIAPLLAANYTFASVDGTLTVAKAVVTITANNATRPYGAVNPVFSYKLSGFVNGDTSSVVLGVARLTTTATAASAAGTYPISVSIAPLLAANYTFTSVNGSLTVGKAVVTITANNVSRPEGAANPVFSYKLSGFANGDTSNVVIGVARMTTTATATSATGPYPISFSVEPLIAANYTFSYVDGTLTVTGGPQTAAIP